MKRMSESGAGSDAIQLAQALGGDRDAFRFLVERHSRGLFRLAYRMTGNEHDAEEVVQDTFLRAYRRMDRFESRSNFGTWLYRIGGNCALDLLRKRKPERERQHSDSTGAPEEDEIVNTLPSNSPAPDRLLWSAEIGKHVGAALETLSPNERGDRPNAGASHERDKKQRVPGNPKTSPGA